MTKYWRIRLSKCERPAHIREGIAFSAKVPQDRLYQTLKKVLGYPITEEEMMLIIKKRIKERDS